MAAKKQTAIFKKTYIRLAIFLSLLLTVAMMSRSALEHYFLYFPSQQHEATPAQAGLNYEEIAFQASDGTGLTGWLIPGTPEAPVVLFCMGNAGNMSHRLDTLKMLHDLGVAVFIFNYRGYGTSEGKASEAGLYADASGAMAFLQSRGWPPERTIIFGRSLGAAVGLETALRKPPAGLIMEAAFTSIKAMGKQHYSLINFLLGWLIDAKFDNLGKINQLSSPLLIIHGSNDSICPPVMAEELYAAAPQNKRYLKIPGAEHNEAMPVGADKYRQALAMTTKEWIKSSND